jgi:predicted RNA-binding protein with PIN domain
MPLLIDGHNLIGRMAGISLDDPDDEIRLVERLRSYHARTSKRVEVYFDHGLPGGRSRLHSTHGVAVIFAHTHTTADALILRRVRQDRHPAALTVVSSDRDLLGAARDLGAQALSSEEFAPRLEPSPAEPTAPADPTLSSKEVDEWLRLFGHGAEND